MFHAQAPSQRKAIGARLSDVEAPRCWAKKWCFHFKQLGFLDSFGQLTGFQTYSQIRRF